MKVALLLLCIGETIAGTLHSDYRDTKEEISRKLSVSNEEDLDAEVTDTYKQRELIRDADRNQICFQDNGNYLASADFYRDPFKANNDRGDWGKCLPEELFGIMCEHEIPHMLNDDSWEKGIGPLHDPPSEELFLQMKLLHDKTCVHIDLDITDEVQEQFNDFLHARNKYASTNDNGNGDLNDVVFRVTDKGGKYYMNGVKAPKLTMLAGVTYTFLVDGLYPSHPFRIGDKDSNAFNDGVTYDGAEKTVIVQLPFDIDVTSLTYYCLAHETMGNTIDVVATPPTTYNVTVSGGKYYLNEELNPEIALMRGETYKFDVSHSTMTGHPFRIGTRGSTSSQSANGFEEAVTLLTKGYEVGFNITEVEFNDKFKACPVVQYTRNERVHSVYIRTSPIPENFNAYKLFTYMWSNANNTLHDDFEIYDNKDDLLEGKQKWKFCNYNDRDVGYPRDCGKTRAVHNRWFSMPGDRFDARGLERGASFHIHSGVGCPSALGPEVPYTKGVTYNDDSKEVIVAVPMDAPSMLTYYCIAHPYPGMGNNIIVPPMTPSRRLQGAESDYDMKITYDMACVQKYPNNPRFAMQMSLYCMTAFFSHGDVSAEHFDSPYEISPSCDNMMRMHKRTLISPSAPSPSDFCDQDIDNDTCTVRAHVRPFLGRTCRSYCESFRGLTCASAHVPNGPWNTGSCLAGREMNCDAEQDREDYLLCTCTTDVEYATKVGAPKSPEQPLTPSATKLLVQPHENMFVCDQNFVSDTVKVFTAKHQTCHSYCLEAGLTCIKAALAQDGTCTTKEERQNCVNYNSNQLCTCAPKVAFDDSKVVEAIDRVTEASQYDLAYKLDIPDKPRFNDGVPYSSIGALPDGLNITRIAYYLQLIDYQNEVQWLWVSMDAFTNDISKIAVPSRDSKAVFQQYVTKLTIKSNHEDINDYEGSGNIEFWPNDYGGNNVKNVKGATNSFDWGDERRSNGSYGSMQVHAADLSTTVFAFNRWNHGDSPDVGIGNAPSWNKDWTYTQMGQTYVFKRLEVFVLSPDTDKTKAPVTAPTVDTDKTNAPVTAPTKSPTATVCEDVSGKFCLREDNCAKKKLKKSCKSWAKKKKCNLEIVASNCPHICGTCEKEGRNLEGSNVRRLDTGVWSELVAVTGRDIAVKTDVGEDQFNAAFNACPVVQYTHNEEVAAVYMRRTPIPEGFNAYKLFTHTWVDANNVLNKDFELYDNMTDLLDESDGWLYCNYGYTGYGFPLYCGKEKAVYNRWFSMPAVRTPPSMPKGASFAVHSKEDCPIHADDLPDDCSETKFLGCFVDKGTRALPHYKGSGTTAQCIDKCAGFKYAARQYTGQCWCGDSGYDKYGAANDCDCGGQNVGGWRNCVHEYDSCWSLGNYKVVGVNHKAESFTNLVALTGSDVNLGTDVGEDAFNTAFSACPAVQYTRNGDVYAVYKRRTPIPEGFNAYKLFTETWDDTDNTLNQDFELYDNKTALINHEDHWEYCNYGYKGIGFPRDCGKTSQTHNNWFAMPGGHYMHNLRKGASFSIHSTDKCPVGELISRNNATAVNNKACERMSLHPNNGIKSYYGADRITPNEPDSCTVEAMLAGRNDETPPTPLSTDGWTRVRHTPKGNKWHKATDLLRGTEVYGSSDDDSLQWSIDFETAVPGYNEFLFATGDKEIWLMTTKAEVMGYYHNEQRGIMKSSQGGVKQARWYRRSYAREDPWISLTDHGDAVHHGYILYGGNSYGHSHASKILPIHDGADVYIRQSDDTGFGSCDDFCNTFKSMKCVGAHGDPNAMFQDGDAVKCDVQLKNGNAACQCALDEELLKEEKAHVSEPTSNACINLAFGGDLYDHQIYEYCDSDKSTCTVNVSGSKGSSRSTYLSLAEVQVYSERSSDKVLENVALKKTTKQSSTGWGGSPSRAVDGNTSGIWGHNSVTHTNSEKKPWWNVDLGNEYVIASIDVFNRKDCCSERLSNFIVDITKDGSTVWTYHHKGHPGDKTHIPVTAGVMGDGVKVSLGRGITCSEFCSSQQGMQCESASAVVNSHRMGCKSGTSIGCDDTSSTDYLQCECGFIPDNERADTLKQGPVLEDNAQESCPAYTKDDKGRNTNESARKYQKVVLTLGVDESPEADGSINVASAKMSRDYSDRNIDSYNTQDVEVCDGLEYTIKKEDPPETCSFGHRYDGNSNCYGKLEMSFSQASEKCAARGGHLLRLDDEDEFNKLNLVYRRQRFSIGMHSDDTKDGMEWDGYPGCKADPVKDLPFLKTNGRNLRQDCWELDMASKSLNPHACTDTRIYLCEAHRPSEKPNDKKSCKSDSDLRGSKCGDLMRDEGGFCLWYLENTKLTLPDDESGGFRNTEISHLLAFSEETRTRKYIKEYGRLLATQEFRGYYDNAANWVNSTRADLGMDSTDPVMDIKHETDDFHCHMSPTNFGISRIYLQQHMLERIYPGAFKKHCFCGYKHMGKLVSRCDCTKNGVRNNNCQKEHRPMMYEATYEENGEYVYCNDNQCDQASP